MTDLELDVMTWFSERQLSHRPNHFIVTKTPVTEKSKQWIFDKLKGRFCFIQADEMDIHDPNDLLSMFNTVPAFEDPAEATFYELTWS